jgi:hypothetical protein
VYVPDAVVHHSFSRSTSAASGRKAYLVERNRIWVMIKNYPLAALLVSPWYTLERYFWQFLGALSGKGMTGQYLRRNSWFSGLTILARSWLAGLIGGAAMIGERRGILGKSRLRSSEFAGMLRKWRATAREVAWGEKS